MSTVSTKHKKKCSSCSKPIQKMQKFTECLGCNNLFHAVPACTKSLNLNDSNIIPTIDLCQHCLADTLLWKAIAVLSDQTAFCWVLLALYAVLSP